MNTSVLSVNNVDKNYGQRKALQGASFNVEKGQIVGLLGPNGSGKTTLIKIINNLITDYTGDIQVCGAPLGVLSKAKISYLPDTIFLRKDIKISTAFGIYRDFFIDFDIVKAQEMLTLVELTEEQRINTLSKGMKEKLQLVLAMARQASLYIFDEPIAGVDPAAREFIIETILKHYSEDGSILFATHLISDVEHFITRVLFLKEGHIILDGDSDELRENRGKSINKIFKEEFKC